MVQVAVVDVDEVELQDKRGYLILNLQVITQLILTHPVAYYSLVSELFIKELCS